MHSLRSLRHQSCHALHCQGSSPVDAIGIEGEALGAIAFNGNTIRWFKNSRGGIQDSRLTDPIPETEEDLSRDVASLVNSIEHVPLRDALPMAKTDAEGRFELAELPADCFFELFVERDGFESTTLVVRNDDGEEVATVPQAEGFDHNPPTKLYPPPLQSGHRAVVNRDGHRDRCRHWNADQRRSGENQYR